MSILIDKETRLLVQGITGGEGSFHTRRCVQYGTNVVGGVTPGKGGTDLDGISVFNTVHQAVAETGANATMIFVPAPFAADAILEAADAGISLIICITEGIPTLDMVMASGHLKKAGARLIGPNCPGVVSAGKCKAGIMSGDIFMEGHVGVVSRSGTLTYEAVSQLSAVGIGQSTCVGLGGDPIIGTVFVEALEMFEKDPETEAVVLIGEIGGNQEQRAADFIKTMTKPVVAFVAGGSAPPGRRMGHAGAIITGSSARAQDKMDALSAAGATVTPSPAEIGTTMQKVLNSKP